ncbi:MAG TPA: hypothetical protein VEX60_18710 [Pyrinomonadaceae bacterium]|nr:hypothetical protein [Pyrinomonadaceae bacterium]
MKLKPPTFLTTAIVCCVVALAQPLPLKGQATEFSSVYTDLKSDCKAAQKSVGEGQDMPLRCKGFGGYEIFIDYSAMSAHLRIQSADGETAVSLPPQPLSYYDNRKLEWRLEQGKPFAVIVRLDRYKDDGGNIDVDTYSKQNKTGEYLLVVGLKSAAYINETIDVKTPNANAAARELADKRFLSGK